MDCRVQNVGSCTSGSTACQQVGKAPENNHHAVDAGVNMVGHTALQALQKTADAQPAGAAGAGLNTGPLYNAFPPLNATGAVDGQYAGSRAAVEPGVVAKYGREKVDAAIQIIENGYQKSGIPTNNPLYVNHEKAFHYLREALNDDGTINLQKMHQSQAAQRANYGTGGAILAGALDEVAGVFAS